jgi:hypothetical protein
LIPRIPIVSNWWLSLAVVIVISQSYPTIKVFVQDDII